MSRTISDIPYTYRVGTGYDIHRLRDDPASPGIMLGGVRIPAPLAVIAHSDGDVVLHALCDALLGAAAAGDLGEHFPDSSAAHAGRASSEFVHEVLALPALKPWRLVNLDLNVIAERPRLSAHKDAMRAHLAELCALPLSRIGVKARTNEGLDAIGRGEAIACQVVVLLEPR